MASVDYLNRLRDLKVPTYTSQYGGVISGLMDKIVNRQPFSYDFNADPIYHQYKDQYVKLGKEAAMNAVANASALTGGYGNSYAVTAGAQANQQALSGLNDIIPQLLNSAQKKYDSDTNALLTQYDLYNQAEQDNYGKFRDEMNDYNNERNYLTGMYNKAVEQENYERDTAEEQRRYEADLALQMAKLNAKGSGNSSGKSDKTDTKANVASIAALAGAGLGMNGKNNVNYNSAAELDKMMADEVNYAKEAARNKANNSSKANASFVVQKGIDVFNGTKDINEVEKMLEAQISKGAISEDEALTILDEIMKNVH